MVQASAIQTALSQHVPSALLEDETTCEYLTSLLMDEDSYDDLEALAESLQSFLEDDQQLADKLIKAIVGDKKTKLEGRQLPMTPATPVQIVEDDMTSSSSSSHDHDEPHSPKSQAAQRKERRRQKKEQRKSKKTKSKSPKRNNGTENNDNANPQNPDDIHTVVTRINAQSAQELNGLDDYSSAWQDVKDGGTSNNKKGNIVWGGRGYGGRGVNRGLGVYKGKDAVVNQLTLSYGGRDLLHETHLVIANGHRYGLMGPNGCGKSTLLRRIASGNVPGWPLHLSVQMVEQEVLGTPKSVMECMKTIQQQGGKKQKQQELEEEQAALEAVLEDANATPEDTEAAAERLSDIYEQLDDIAADSDASETESKGAFAGLNKRAKTILKGLQFQKSMLHTHGNVLSGGWRMRLALAQALYAAPDILLLDEPTNHLDLSAIMFLEQWIVSHSLTVVVVSHDGHFLDSICSDMIKFDSCKLKYHVGNYSSFRESEEQMWARNTKKAEAAAKKEKKAMEFIQKQRSMANSKHRDDNKQRQAAERQKKLGRIGLYSENGQKFKLLAEGNTKKGGSNRAGHISGNYTNSAGFQSFFVSNEEVAFGENQQLLNFKFPAAVPLKGGSNMPLITMEDCKFRYPSASEDTTADPQKWLLEDVTLNVSNGSRIAIVGKNGAGKSTLLKLLCGELSVNSGKFHRHPNLKVAHIAQHHIEQLANYLECTPVEYFMKQHHAKSEQEARQFLGGFGLVGPLALQLIGTLSGGQKARLAFATVMCKEPHVLVLDEPTNHLDSKSLESLAIATDRFQGAVIIVSHHQDFMSRCAKEMWTVANGHVKVEMADEDLNTFDDLFDDYKNSLRKDLKKK